MLDWVDDLANAVWAGVGTLVFGAIGMLIYFLFFAFIAQIWPAHAEQGVASVYSYGHGTLRGHPTACGNPFNPGLLTAAHRTLACGTVAKVTTRRGRSVIVRITDRGPFRRGRIIDLTPAAAHALRMDGLAMVSVVRCKDIGSCERGAN